MMYVRHYAKTSSRSFHHTNRFTAQLYAAIVFAVLLSCITSPFMLLNMIKYFNKKQKAYLDAAGPLFLHNKAMVRVYLFNLLLASGELYLALTSYEHATVTYL